MCFEQVGRKMEYGIHSIRRTMSVPKFAKLPEEVLKSAELSPSDKLVYAALAWHCWKNNTVFIGAGAIAKLINLSVRTVKSSLATLHEKRFITKFPRKIGEVNAYVLTSANFAPVPSADFAPYSRYINKTELSPEQKAELRSLQRKVYANKNRAKGASSESIN